MKYRIFPRVRHLIRAAMVAVFLGPSVLIGSVINLGDGQNFNAVIFGNHTVAAPSPAIVEGRLAVGGDSSLEGGYSVGVALVGDPLPQSSGTRDDLVVGGDLDLIANVSVDRGNVKVGGEITGSGGISTADAANTTSQNVPNFSSVFDFAATYSLVKGYSQYWATLPTSGSVIDQSSQLDLVGTNPQVNVFNVTADQWDTFSRHLDIPIGSHAIINILGANHDYSGSVIAENESWDDLRGRVIYNFPDAETILSTQLLWQGSVFAPDATFTGVGGDIWGQAFLGVSEQQEGFSFLNSLTVANVPVPEPGVAFLAVFAVAALSCRRQR